MSKQIHIIKDTEHTEEFDHSEQKDKEQGGVLLREKIAECFYYFHDWDGKTKWEDVNEREICYDFAEQILAKAREAVEGAGLTEEEINIELDKWANCVGGYENLGQARLVIAEAQTKAILKALGGE